MSWKKEKYCTEKTFIDRETKYEMHWIEEVKKCRKKCMLKSMKTDTYLLERVSRNDDCTESSIEFMKFLNLMVSGVIC